MIILLERYNHVKHFFQAHRIVLIAACPMLQNMENASLGSHLEVRMASDIKQDSVNAFLQYIYEGYMMLTEDNCRDIEKMAKLLQVESVVKCCVDFYKCISSKTGVQHGGHNMNYQESPDFKHFRITQIQKLVQDGANKRQSDSSRPGSPGGKRQRVQRSASPNDDVVVLGSYRPDDRSSMSSSYKPGGQDPFERIPRLGAGPTRMEDTLEVVHKDPPERDAEGWPKESHLPPIHRSQAISVSSQYSKETNIQIVNVPSEGERQRVQGAVHREPPRPPEPQQSYSPMQRSPVPREQPRPAPEVHKSMPSSSFVPQSLQQSNSPQKINLDPLPSLQGPAFSAIRPPVPTHIMSSQPSHPMPTPPRLTSKPFAAGSAMQASAPAVQPVSMTIAPPVVSMPPSSLAMPSSSVPIPQSEPMIVPDKEKDSTPAQGSSSAATSASAETKALSSAPISLTPATPEQIHNVEQLLAGGDMADPQRLVDTYRQF